MNVIRGWLQGRFVRMATALVAGILLFLTFSLSTSRLPLPEQNDDHLKNDRIVSASGPSTLGTQITPSTYSAVTAIGPTSTSTWSHGVPYTIQLSNFPAASSGGPADNFVSTLVDAAAYFTMSTTSTKTRWNHIKATNNGGSGGTGGANANTVTLTFLPQCPYASNHISQNHGADPAGTGKIIVITMNVATTSPNNITYTYFTPNINNTNSNSISESP